VGLGVSRAVGALLPSLALAILGLWLLKKPTPPSRIGTADKSARAHHEPIEEGTPKHRSARRRNLLGIGAF